MSRQHMWCALFSNFISHTTLPWFLLGITLVIKSTSQIIFSMTHLKTILVMSDEYSHNQKCITLTLARPVEVVELKYLERPLNWDSSTCEAPAIIWNENMPLQYNLVKYKSEICLLLQQYELVFWLPPLNKTERQCRFMKTAEIIKFSQWCFI